MCLLIRIESYNRRVRSLTGSTMTMSPPPSFGDYIAQQINSYFDYTDTPASTAQSLLKSHQRNKSTDAGASTKGTPLHQTEQIHSKHFRKSSALLLQQSGT
jgi:hypothetical protein